MDGLVSITLNDDQVISLAQKISVYQNKVGLTGGLDPFIDFWNKKNDSFDLTTYAMEYWNELSVESKKFIAQCVVMPEILFDNRGFGYNNKFFQKGIDNIS